MSRTREEIELSLGEAMNIPILQQQYLSDKLADMFRELPSSKVQDVLKNIEENIYEICSEEPSPNTSKLDYVLKKWKILYTTYAIPEISLLTTI